MGLYPNLFLYLVGDIIINELSMIISMFAIGNYRGRKKHSDFLAERKSFLFLIHAVYSSFVNDSDKMMNAVRAKKSIEK